MPNQIGLSSDNQASSESAISFGSYRGRTRRTGSELSQAESKKDEKTELVGEIEIREYRGAEDVQLE